LLGRRAELHQLVHAKLLGRQHKSNDRLTTPRAA
jgi:hypothetical protein